jgi:hypothetical protein
MNKDPEDTNPDSPITVMLFRIPNLIIENLIFHQFLFDSNTLLTPYDEVLDNKTRSKPIRVATTSWKPSIAMIT